MSTPVQRLHKQHGFPLLDEHEVDDFLRQHEHCVLFFSEDPKRYPESNDVAVILPELIKVFGNRLTAAVIAGSAEKALQARYGFNRWPALVFIRRGQYLGAITRVRDWNDYIQEIQRVLAAEPSHPPGVGIPVVHQPAGGCS
jgi:hydrogenase-1 operon protein HyaE